MQRQRSMSQLRPVVDAAYARNLKLSSNQQGGAVLAEGLWDNPNHFFRLRMLLAAVPESERGTLAAVMHSRSTKAIHDTLRSLGFERFYHLEDFVLTDADNREAEHRLCHCRNNADLLDIALPDGMPAYICYDTVLKIARHPRPPLDHPLWHHCLADLFRLMRAYEAIFDDLSPRLLVLSHPWKNEFATGLWCAMSQKIPALYLSGMYESTRVRRFEGIDDYARPVEHMSGTAFAKLPPDTRVSMTAAGYAYLRERWRRTSTDVNEQMAYHPHQRLGPSLRERYGIPRDRKTVLIAGHVWYDFPHAFAMRNFTDFLDWIETTMGAISTVDAVTWLLKPHPTESWYGGFRLADTVGRLPSHIVLLDEETDVVTALDASDAVVTMHGTIAVEATVHGLPVVCADRSYFDDWNFAFHCQSREEYLSRLHSIVTLPPPSTRARNDAAAFAYLMIAPPERETGLLRLAADSCGPALYEDILSIISANPGLIERESALLSEWLRSGSNSYSIFHKLRHHAKILQSTSDACVQPA